MQTLIVPFQILGKTIIELTQLTDRNKDYPDEYYEITVQDNRFILSSHSAHGLFNACQTLLNMLGNASQLPVTFSNIQIADYPDTDYRGLMLDVARNFTKKGNILKLIDYLASYKISVLHLHLTDDRSMEN